jgi:tripartite-type tricarboxylate transporter receptor subunit TctC
MHPNLPARVIVALTILLACLAGPVRAQEYPSRVIRIIVPISTGSTTDVVARIVAEGMRASFGQSVIVENRPGAGGTVGSTVVAKAAPDGYTLLVVSSAHTSNPVLYSKLPYDGIADFKGISMLASMPQILVTAPSKNLKSVADLVERARAKPGTLTYGSGGVGSAVHMNAEQFRAMAKFEALHVPYRGTPEVVTDLISGAIDFSFIPAGNVLGAIREGRLLALATGTEQRSRLLPDVPTTVEAGIPGSSYGPWIGMFAPAGTPPAVLDRLNREVQRILRTPEAQQKLASFGADAAPMTTDAFDAQVVREVANIRELVRVAKIPVSN